MRRITGKVKALHTSVLFLESFQEPSLFQLFAEPQGHSVWKGGSGSVNSCDIFLETFRQEAGHQGDLGQEAE